MIISQDEEGSQSTHIRMTQSIRNLKQVSIILLRCLRSAPWRIVTNAAFMNFFVHRKVRPPAEYVLWPSSSLGLGCFQPRESATADNPGMPAIEVPTQFRTLARTLASVSVLTRSYPI